MTEPIWRLQIGHGPLVATAIHDGHELREELLEYVSLDEAGRLREEDPFTGHWTNFARRGSSGCAGFETDLNRLRDKAVYRTPEDAWGLKVWTDTLPDASRQSITR